MSPRIHLPEPQWPVADRTAWAELFREGDVFDGHGAACHWADVTRRTNHKHYARWLGWLAQEGALDPEVAPAARATQGQVRAYGWAMRDSGLAWTTINSALVGLKCVLLRMAPEADWQWLRDLTTMTKFHAKPSRDHGKRHLPGQQVYDTLCVELDRLRAAAGIYQADRIAYRDTLIMAVLLCAPIRLKNLAALRIGGTLVRRGDEVRIEISAGETKTGRAHAAVIADVIVPHLVHYLETIRPQFCGADAHDWLWPAARGAKQMAHETLYAQIMKRSQALFGVGINPHAFRTIGATFLAEHAIDAPTLAAALLGHGDLRTTEAHYIRASQLAAGRTVAAILAATADPAEAA